MSNPKVKSILIPFAIVAVIILIPFGIDWLIIGNNFPSNITNTDWVGFLGAYLGSIVSAIGIMITIKYTNNQNKRDRENQVRPYCTLRFMPAGKGITVPSILNRFSIGCGEVHENPECYECFILVKNIGLGPAIEFEIDIDSFDDGREHYPLLLQRTTNSIFATVNSLQPGEESAILFCIDYNFDRIPDEKVISVYEDALGKTTYTLSSDAMEKYKNYLVTVNIKYHDMYENVFLQKVMLQSEICNLIDKDGHAKYTGRFRLEDKTIPQKI